MKIAIVHDYLNQYGGAERVLEVLLEMFPEADVYALFYSPEKLNNRFQDRDIKTSFLDLKLVHNHHRFFIPLMPLAARNLNLGGRYDLIISDTAGYAKGIRYDRRQTKHICYCYTPLRYAWESDYRVPGIRSRVFGDTVKFLTRPVLHYLQRWDFRSAQKPDKIIAISNHIARKVKNYYKREAEVLYPPVNTDKFYLSNEELPRRDKFDAGQAEIGNYEYFLTAGRLTHYKRYDIIVEAFNKLGWPLKIVGAGPELKRLKKIANFNIEFLGFIKSDDEMRKIYNNASAFIFAGVEDFGLVMAEAQACGTPVIAFRGGGAIEIVEEGKTGLFFDKQSAESLVTCLRNFRIGSFDRQYISQFTKRFSTENFKTELQKRLVV